MLYLVVLFAAAFTMLFMAYLMQQRTNDAAIDSLQDSLASFQSNNELISENRELRAENEDFQAALKELEEQVAALEQENDALNQQYINASNQANRAQAEASLRGALYAAEYLYESGDNQAAAQRLASIPGDDLLLLSTTSDGGVPSDSQRYEALKNALIEAGCLTEDPNSGQLQAISPEA